MQEKNPRDRKCYYSASGITAWPLAKLYVDELFHKANRAATLQMLEGVRYVCKYVYMHACMHVSTHTHTHTHTHIHIA